MWVNGINTHQKHRRRQKPHLSPCPPLTAVTTPSLVKTRILPRTLIKITGNLTKGGLPVFKEYWQSCLPLSSSILDKIKQAKRNGRGIRRLVTLCGTVTQLIAEYDRRLLESESNDDNNNNGDGDDDDDDNDPSPEKKEEMKR